MAQPSRDKALALLHEWVQSESLRRHMYAVEAALRAYARHYGEDEELWGLTGLLHDLDYERFPNMERDDGHPRTALRLFRANEYDPALIHAVEAHATFLDIPCESKLDKALLACDELTGLIQAAAYVRPDRNLRNVEVSSLKKKWKDKAFTAAINRPENMVFIEALGEPFEEHLARVLAAMQGIAEELGVAGPPPEAA